MLTINRYLEEYNKNLKEKNLREIHILNISPLHRSEIPHHFFIDRFGLIDLFGHKIQDDFKLNSTQIRNIGNEERNYGHIFEFKESKNMNKKIYI